MSAILCCACGAVSDSDGATLACGHCFATLRAEVEREKDTVRVQDRLIEAGRKERDRLRAEVERLRGLKEASDRGIQRLKDSAALRTSEWEKRFRVIVGEDSPDAAGNAVIALKARAEKAERERDEFQSALYESYVYTGADAGDADDFNALVNKKQAVTAAVLNMRERWDAAEARAEKAERESLINRVAVSDIAACAGKLAAALREINEYAQAGGLTHLTAIAARALADGEEK